MDYEIGCDAHKYYSQLAVLDQDGRLFIQDRVDHRPGAIQAFLEKLPKGRGGALRRSSRLSTRCNTRSLNSKSASAGELLLPPLSSC